MFYLGSIHNKLHRSGSQIPLISDNDHDKFDTLSQGTSLNNRFSNYEIHITLNKLLQRVVWWAGSTDVSKEHTVFFCRLNPEDGGTILFRNDGIQQPRCTVSQAKDHSIKLRGRGKLKPTKPQKKSKKYAEYHFKS